MTQRDAAAIRVQAFAREGAKRRLDAGFSAHKLNVFERLDVEQNLRGESLMNLP